MNKTTRELIAERAKEIAGAMGADDTTPAERGIYGPAGKAAARRTVILSGADSTGDGAKGAAVKGIGFCIMAWSMQGKVELPVYLTPKGVWSVRKGEGRTFPTKDEATAELWSVQAKLGAAADRWAELGRDGYEARCRALASTASVKDWADVPREG